MRTINNIYIDQVKNGISNYVGQFSAILFSLISTPFIIGNIGVEEWGLYCIIIAVQPLVYIFGLGIPEILNREITKSLTIKKDHFTSNVFNSFQLIILSISIVIFIFFWSLSDLISIKILSSNINSKLTSDCLLLISVILSTRLLETFYVQVLSGLKKFYILNIILTSSSFFKWCSCLLFIFFFNAGIYEIILIHTFFSILTALFFYYYTNSIVVKSNNINPPRNYRSFFTSTMLTTSLFIVLTQFDRIIVLFISNDFKNFATYALSTTIAIILSVLSKPIIMISTFHCNFLFHNSSFKELKFYFMNSFKIIWTILITPFLITIFFPREVMFLWIGNFNELDLSADFLRVSAFGFFFSGINLYLQNIQITFRKVNFLLISLFISLVIIGFLLGNLFTIHRLMTFAYLWSFFNFLIFITSSLFVCNFLIKLSFIKFITEIFIKNVSLTIIFFIVIKFLIIFSDSRVFLFIQLSIIILISFLISFLHNTQIKNLIFDGFSRIKNRLK